MDPDKAAEHLKVIRQLMERPVRCSTLSGLSAILAGCAALGGLALDHHFSTRYDAVTAFWINLVVWLAVFAAACAAVTTLTYLREHREGLPFWSAAKRRGLMTIVPPFAAGAGLTLAVVYRWYLGIEPNQWGQWGLIPAVWMLFYGVACWEVGEFSNREIRFLGAAFILAGLAAGAFCQPHPYWAMGITFGGFHIVYGIIVWIRHGG